MNTASGTEAAYYTVQDDQVQCRLCPHACLLSPGEHGICRVRVNRAGELIAFSYGRVSALAVDPVEKKPLYHFYPGHTLLSLGSYGCNLGCDFCQNWELSQRQPSTREYSPEDVVSAVRRTNAECIGVAYTYSEPLVWFEFVLDTAKRVHDAGYKNVLVTNGYINLPPLDELLQYVDAVNLDLKGFTREFYTRVCQARPEPVKRTLSRLVEEGIHTEVTNLIIPGENDDTAGLEELYRWLGGLSRTLPVHVNRYFPAYKRTTPATPIETLREASRIASHYLDYVYIGNLTFSNLSETRCPQCGAVLVQRSGYQVRIPVPVEDGRCSQCGAPAPFVGTSRRRSL